MSIDDLTIFTGNANPRLAAEVVDYLKMPLGKARIEQFSDGEIAVEILENIRGRDVFIIQPTCAPSHKNLMELLLMIDACNRSSANRVTAVLPYYGYARQDRRPRNLRVPISAKLIASMISTAGADRVLTMDLHADQIQGFFEKPVDHLFASTIFVPYVKSLNLDNLTIASPDMGGSKRAYAYSKFLKSDVVICYKQREKANVISHMELIGDVKGKNVVLVDDMVDTAGTLTKAAEVMRERGALSVRAICTHALLSGNAYERIENSLLEELIVTDSIPAKKQSPKIKVLSCADLFASTMREVHENKSISSKFIV